jgi:hypothetical protein
VKAAGLVLLGVAGGAAIMVVAGFVYVIRHLLKHWDR